MVTESLIQEAPQLGQTFQKFNFKADGRLAAF